jgi:Tfp pilus assembly protein PilF
MQTKLVSLIVLFLLVLAVSISFAADDPDLQRGISQYKAENYEEALELLLKAKASQPSSSTVSYYLGLTYKQLEKHQLAKEQLILALSQTPAVQDAYTELIETLYLLDELSAARQWLTKAEQAGIAPAHIAFLDGLLSIKEGNYDHAIAAFNKAKGLDSSLTQTADFQIALANVKLRRYDEAKKSFQTIRAMAPNSDLAGFAQEYERALDKTVETSKKWQITAGVAYQYDSNVLLKPTHDITGVGITNESDSSIVATFGLITPTWVSGQWSLSGRYNFYSNTHFSLHTHDIITNTVSLTPAYTLGKGALSFPVSYSHVWLDQQQYLGLLSFRPTLQYMLAPGHIIQASAGYAKQEMKEAAIDPDEDRDANIYIFTAGYIHPFNNGKSLFNIFYEYAKMDTDGRNWENSGHRITAGLLLPFLRNDLNLILSGEALFQDYDNTNTVFGIKREDKIYTGSANLRWDISKITSINLQYSYTRADSNIAIYDYSRNIVTVGMELQF